MNKLSLYLMQDRVLILVKYTKQLFPQLNHSIPFDTLT